MESSGIGVSLRKLVRNSTKCLGGIGLLVCFLPSLSGAAAQAPGTDGRSLSSVLPRFTLREIVAGHSHGGSRIPARWVKAALAANPDSLAVSGYHKAAGLSRLVPLEGSVLASERSRYVLGLYRRSELADVVRGTLQGIRGTLPSDSARARFDALFHPKGEWIADLHDAAMAWARIRDPGISWESPRRALAAIRWIPAGDSLPSGEAVPWALYSLTVLAGDDSAAFRAVRSDLERADSTSAAAALLLLKGYDLGQDWYIAALKFFLNQRWAPHLGKHYSLVDHVRSYWRRLGSGPAPEPPEIHARLFGHPQAVPHYGVPAELFERLVRADNGSARVWLDRHGQAGLLRALRRLPAGDTTLVLLQIGAEALRLTTVPRQSRESLNGFLEPQDAIAIDPGYSPLLAIGAVVHEWQHLIFRRRQLDAFVAALPGPKDSVIELPWLDPYLAEGFAEWSTEEILASVVERWPVLALAELQKRAALGGGAQDHHTMGYALVRTLGAVLGDPAATTKLLLRSADQPSRAMSHPAVRRAWRRYDSTGDLLVAGPAHRILIPEITFTVEDGFPDVIANRILIPPSRRGRR